MFDLTEKYGPEVTKVWIFDQLSDYALFVNAGKNFSKEQLNQTADLIMMAYSNFHMTDFKLFFTRCKLGHYGKLFDVLDGQILLGWLAEYKNDRITAAEQISIQEAHQFKQLEKEPMNLNTSQEYIDAIKAILSEVKPSNDNQVQKTKNVTQKRSHAEWDRLQKRWMKQFYNLHRGSRLKDFRFGESSVWMIKVGNLKPLSVNEFLLYKSR